MRPNILTQPNFSSVITGIIHPIPNILGTHHGKNNSIYRPSFPFCFPSRRKRVHPTQRLCSRSGCRAPLRVPHLTAGAAVPDGGQAPDATAEHVPWNKAEFGLELKGAKPPGKPSLPHPRCHNLGSPRRDSALPAGARALPGRLSGATGGP